MGDILNLQATIGRDGIDEKIKDSVGIICEDARITNHIAIQRALLDLQDSEGMDKIKYRHISEFVVIKAELQTTIDMVKNINQDQRRLM